MHEVQNVVEPRGLGRLCPRRRSCLGEGVCVEDEDSMFFACLTVVAVRDLLRLEPPGSLSRKDNNKRQDYAMGSPLP